LPGSMKALNGPSYNVIKIPRIINCHNANELHSKQVVQKNMRGLQD